MNYDTPYWAWALSLGVLLSYLLLFGCWFLLLFLGVVLGVKVGWQGCGGRLFGCRVGLLVVLFGCFHWASC